MEHLKFVVRMPHQPVPVFSASGSGFQALRAREQPQQYEKHTH